MGSRKCFTVFHLDLVQYFCLLKRESVSPLSMIIQGRVSFGGGAGNEVNSIIPY